VEEEVVINHGAEHFVYQGPAIQFQENTQGMSYFASAQHT
jgi:hypothetical protein